MVAGLWPLRKLGEKVHGSESMKAAVKVLSKGGLAEAIAAEAELKKRDCSEVLDSLAAVVTKQVKSVGHMEMLYMVNLVVEELEERWRGRE